MKTSNLTKINVRYLSTSCICPCSPHAQTLISSSRPLLHNRKLNYSHSLISSSGSYSYFHHSFRKFSACSISCPWTQSLNCLSFSRFSLRFFSLSASQCNKLHAHHLRPEATRNQVSVIIGLLITEDKDLKTKLNSLSFGLSIADVSWVFNFLDSKKKPALDFFHWIRRWQPELERNSHVCSMVVRNCGCLNDYDAMRCLLKDFSLNGLFISKKAFEYLNVISANEDLLRKCTSDVVGILQEVGGTSYGSGVYSLIEMFSELGFFDMALFVIGKTERKLSYYNVLIKVVSQRCDVKAARNLMDEMRKEGCNPNAQTYNYVISGLLKNGKYGDACNVFKEMKERGCPPDALTFEIFIYKSCNGGKLDKACEFLNEMVATGLEPRLLTHAAFIKGFVNAQQYEKAYKYVVDSADKHSSNVNYSLLADLHQKRGNLVDAVNILSEMIQKGLRPNLKVYMRVKNHIQKSGNTKLALDLQKKFHQLDFRA
ncbi:pentatricopeptide repeat-containing protein At5g61990, mitochondrial-like [Mercurialis annua]|uniref:pentatricopeptide repeat-containing protein At5g61990, mitochondrial-like n=1 Tax=Mercurialis annua TaxID=3986 RepID=UPI002160A6BC|nr:pentatricopeptide repeat-containing protein At5g61990, mitochondrial-like [Mercurialis annua]XP_050220099.1 pentatricopeptide repeat-containing protein At5g61990, mitochondrial-like [Mercurialis annua]XP_050220100.1 pentatricopeptide repeat-containing protein At5g61990, mitochondrial-like [Mercurialis annua]